MSIDYRRLEWEFGPRHESQWDEKSIGLVNKADLRMTQKASMEPKQEANKEGDINPPQ